MWLFSNKGESGFSSSSTAEQVTDGIDASGLTAIVTGASSGIGKETARVLALRGVHVVMAVRDMDAGRKAKNAIVEAIPKAQGIGSRVDGVGEEVCIRIQFYGPSIEHPHTMKRTAIESKKEGRIVNVSSRRHKLSYHEGIRFDKINDESSYNSLSAYGQSKLANVLHANELARRLKEDRIEITSNSVHPGAIATNLFRHYGLLSGLVDTIGKYVLKNVEQGAATTCYAALHPQVKGTSGKYFADSNMAKTSLHAEDADLAKKLWDFSMSLLK